MRVTILHGSYIHVEPKWKVDDKGSPVLNARNERVSERPYGHDAPAKPGDTISVSKAEAARMVAAGTAKLA